jgi:alkanesulfonate monooxygenase SsuD/methylene tetrahydromethanopterin reductase-like flavin-dependent oxidoreductase (luciferase family)
MLLPIADPVRLAEDAATVAILSDGRFDIGVGLGYREVEFAQFGRSLRNRPSLMEEGVEILRRAWSGEPVSFAGKRFRVGGLPITPVPAAPPRILMGGMSEPAIQRAARLGDGFLSTGGIGHDVYEAAIEQEERAGAIFAGHWAIVAEDPEAEAARVGAHALYQANEYVRWGAFGPPDQVPLFPDAAAALRDGLYELWDPEQAVSGLSALLRAHPLIEDVHFWAQLPGEPIEQGSARIELLAREVLPRVRERIA